MQERAADAALASYVPMVVLQRMAELGGGLQEARVDTLHGALMFADISGFTALTERLVARGPAGIELLVRRLNAYFGSLIEVIVAHGGDVLKFAGDALVVHFTEASEMADDAASRREAVLRAAACGLAVQQAVAAEKDAEEGLTLSLKVAVAQGKLACAFLGGVRRRWEMVVSGAPLLDAGDAAGKCTPGWVVLSPWVWQLIASDATAEPAGGGVMRLLSTNSQPVLASMLLPALSEAAAQAAWTFVPYAIRARLGSGQGDWLAEMRKITVIFVTLPGHTSEGGLLHTQELMTRMQQLIYRVEGSVNKISVDDKGLSLVAVLGMPPLSHEDDPRRGLLLALEMHELMLRMDVTPSIGVTTGRAFCGVIGNVRRREYTMIGDIVNLSARLMVASAGEVLCDQATRDGALDHFEFEPTAPLALKGKAAPVLVYRPARRSTRRLQASNRFIGRAADCAEFEHALQRLVDGESAAYLIESDPGIGKSRLLAEVNALAAERGLRRLQGEADSIDRESAYVAWRGLLADLLGLEGVTASGVLTPAGLARLDEIPGRRARAPLLNAILPLGIAETEVTQLLEGEARAAALRDLIVELLADETPLLILIDDAQWLDSASWALLMAVVREVQPLLLVAATRPVKEAEQTPELRELLRHANTRQLRLEGLTHAETAELIHSRLDVDHASEALLRFVADRTQGNAFFIEQLLPALRDAQLIEIQDRRCTIRAGVDLATEANLPDTVEGAITQRIDHLDPTEQLSLKVASVVGRAFGVSVINAIFPIEHLRGQLRPYLDALARHGLTSLDGTAADDGYLFRQILTQEVAYNLMLLSQRQALHLAVADWYEANFADCSPFYAVIAHHLVQAGSAARAIGYLIHAGDQALATFACVEAASLFGEAISLAATRPEIADARRTAHCHLQMGHANYLLGRLEQGTADLRRGLALSGSAVPVARIGKLWGVLSGYAEQQFWRRFPDRRRAASPQQQQALCALAHAYRDLCTCHYIRSEILDLVFCGLRSVNCAERLGPSPELAEALAIMSFIASVAGRQQLAAECFARASALLPQMLDPARRANMLVGLAVYSSTRCGWEEVITRGEEVIQLAQSISNWRLLQNGLYAVARAASRLGRLRLSYRTYERLEQLGRRVDNGQAVAWGLSGMLQSQLVSQRDRWEQRMDAVRALLLAEAGRGHLSGTDEAFCAGGIALALQRLGRLDQAELEAYTTGDIILATDAVATHMLDPLAWVCDIHLARWKQLGDEAGQRRRRLRQLGAVLRRFSRKYTFAPPIALRIRGECRCLEGRSGKGLADLRAALADAMTKDMNCEVARCHHALAEHLPPNCVTEADHFAQAQALYRRLDMCADLARLEQLSSG
ncbi:MAG: AAA family ATPase [Pseudomarimonas sp.]